MINFDNLRTDITASGANTALLAANGFVQTDKEVCHYNVASLILHMEFVYDELDVQQKENIDNIHNQLKL